MTTLPKRPEKLEEKWVDFDESTQCWGVFGLDSGFCYSLHYTEATALKQLNSVTENKVDPKTTKR